MTTDFERNVFFEQRERSIREQSFYYSIPPYMVEGLIRYVCEGILPGDFMRAVLANDFLGAAKRADEANQVAFWGWAGVLHNAVPPEAFGSVEKIAEWKDHRGLRGLFQEERSGAPSRD